MSKITPEKEIEEFFTRSVGNFIDPENSFKEKLLQKIKGSYKAELIVKFGIDPTRPDIHLGHAVVLRKLRQLQDWGCKIVFLIGDFTAQIGDPTNRSKTRPEIEQSEVEKNLKTYLEQVRQILRTEKTVFSWIRNSDWFTSITDLNLPDDYKVNLEIKDKSGAHKIDIVPNSFIGKAVVFEKTRMQIKDLGLKGKVSVVTLRSFLWALKHVTFSQLIERDMFQDRIKAGNELFMHEFIYPVLQGIDSQILAQIYGSCDLEVGGTDQLFNMLMGRNMMKANSLPPQSVLAFSLLVGTDGKEKMSKSLDNYISINEAAGEIFGKVMSIPDSLIIDYFTLATYSPVSVIKDLELSLKKEEVNPRDIKLRLGREIVTIYHGEAAGIAAETDFLNTFQKGQIPKDIKTIEVEKNRFLSEILLSEEIVKSKSDFKRLLDEGAISDVVRKSKITDLNFTVAEDTIFKIGKKRFLSVKVKS